MVWVSRPYGAPFKNTGGHVHRATARHESFLPGLQLRGTNQLVGAVRSLLQQLNDNKESPLRQFLNRESEQYVSVGENSPTYNRQRTATHFIPVNWINFYKGCRPKKGEAEIALRPWLPGHGWQCAGTEPAPYEAFCVGGNNSVRGFNNCDLGVGRATSKPRLNTASRFSKSLAVNSLWMRLHARAQGDVPASPVSCCSSLVRASRWVQV